MAEAALISAHDLERELGSENLRILDATTHLRREVDGGPYVVETGEEEYLHGHIPGALFADMSKKFSDVNSTVAFALPAPEMFATSLGELGVGPDHEVVVYAQESPMWATRLWWLLRYFGFERVRVLNGGLDAWRRGGFALTTAPTVFSTITFTAHPRAELLAKRNDVEGIVAKGGACLINALGRDAFLGETASYHRPGRIPGSENVPSRDLLDPETGAFRELDELRQRFSALLHGGQPLVAYCGAGISATVDVFALSLLGRDDVRLYDGSMSEWSADPRLPLEVGVDAER